jgi:hypothetical protein
MGKHNKIGGAQPIISGRVCEEETSSIIHHKTNETKQKARKQQNTTM